MEINKIYQGSCMDVIKTFSDKSINAVITSPPYWQLRDYGWSGQWGLEPTYQHYLENLWGLMDEIFRVLKDDGTVWINLGDTYGGTGAKKDGNYGKINYIDQKNFSGNNATAKCLLLIPHRFAIGCIDRGWIMRNDIVWAKRNAMPEPVEDRFSKKHEYFLFMVKNEKYYFDIKAVREKCKPLNRWGGQKLIAKGLSEWDEGTGQNTYRARDMQPNDGMKNPGSVADFWDIPTQPSSDKHYAAYNDILVGKPIVGGCPKDGIILDPFCGTATTGCRALELGRNFIGIEGNEKYVEMGNRKLLPFIQQKQLF